MCSRSNISEKNALIRAIVYKLTGVYKQYEYDEVFKKNLEDRYDKYK